MTQSKKSVNKAMPASIPMKDMKRMFPFEFYYELSQQLGNFTLVNDAFFTKTIYQQIEKEAETEQEREMQDALYDLLVASGGGSEPTEEHPTKTGTKRDMTKIKRFNVSKTEQEKMFNASRETVGGLLETLAQNGNIATIDVLGDVLLLDVMCERGEEVLILDPERRMEVPISFLFVQLYDSASLPVFSSNVEPDVFEKIPEVLWDDPNLLIGVIRFTPQGALISVAKSPDHVEQAILASQEQDEK